MFVRYDCGCEALRVVQPLPGNEPPRITISLLHECDESAVVPTRFLAVSSRLFRVECRAHDEGKPVPFAPLAPEKAADYAERIRKLANDGMRAREAVSLLDTVRRNAEEDPT